MKFFFDSDTDLECLKGKTIAVIGFGSQGSAQAQCLKDSGVNVVVGLRENSKSIAQVRELGFEFFSIKEAVERADIVHVLVPDEVQAQVYEKEIEPVLGKAALSFSHGFNIVFKKIVPPESIDVFMVAPHAPGSVVRELFLQNKGVPALFGVHQNKSGHAKETALAMAKACGFTRAGVYECSFKQETFSDLFAEQTVLCGGLSELVKAGFETLVEAGYPKEMAYLACVYEIKLISKLISENGIEGMWKKVSNTAEYGGRTRGPKIVDENAKKKMKEILTEIEKGEFAEEWVKEFEGGLKKLEVLRKEGKGKEIEEAALSLKKIL